MDKIELRVNDVLVYSQATGEPPPPIIDPPVIVPPVPAGVQVVTAAWPSSGQSMARTWINNFTSQIIALKITAPANVGTAIKVGRIVTAEKPGYPNTFREFWVSTGPASGTVIYDGRGQPDQGPGGSYSINDPNFAAHMRLFNLQPGGTVYFNLRNFMYDSASGPQDMFCDLGAPT